ncbi:MAG: ATPase [Gammaproteobacteria bacterium]|nr:ATPase [Gammaproteobacteria bacterium]
MEDVLKELLDTELQAEALVREANARHEQMIRDARSAVLSAEQRFAARIPEIHKTHLQKIDERAEQSIAELRRRYDERRRELRAVAEGRQQSALDAAIGVITDPERE